VGKLLPVDFAALGPAEFLWLLLFFGGLSLLDAPGRARRRSAILVGVALVLLGIVRLLSESAGEGAWSRWLGPVVTFPLVGVGVVLLGHVRAALLARVPGRRLAAVWVGALVVLSLAARPFGLGPLADLPEWIFLACAGFALAALFEGPDGPLAPLLARRVGPVRGATLGAVAFAAFCAVARPFGVGLAGAVGLVFTLWVVREIVAQGREMQRYVSRRLVEAPFVLFILLLLSFVLMRLAPGGPFDKEKRVDPDILRQIEAKYLLDRPLDEQFRKFVVDLAWDGDLGPSFKHKDRTVNEIIAEHVGPSAVLGLAAIAIALLIGVTAGLVSGIRQNSIFDYASMTGAMLGLSLPTFVVGPMLVLLFAVKVDWFNVTGWEDFPKDLVLPALTLSLPFAARIARLTRAGMLEIVNQDYIRTARAKGLSEPAIVIRHTLKGTLLPVVSFLGPAIAQLLTGSLVVEIIFGVPGIGREFVESATNRDYGLAMGLVLLFGSLLILFNLVVDVAYAFLDPRIRHG